MLYEVKPSHSAG